MEKRHEFLKETHWPDRLPEQHFLVMTLLEL